MLLRLERKLNGMDIQIRTVDDITVVDLAGEVDGKTAPLAQAQIVPLTRGGGKLLLDMTRVTYMSSAGLRMLLLLYRQMATNNGRVALVGLSEEITDTMAATGFLSYFATSDTLESGLAALNQ